jgi:hypothetical protein
MDEFATLTAAAIRQCDFLSSQFPQLDELTERLGTAASGLGTAAEAGVNGLRARIRALTSATTQADTALMEAAAATGESLVGVAGAAQAVGQGARAMLAAVEHAAVTMQEAQAAAEGDVCAECAGLDRAHGAVHDALRELVDLLGEARTDVDTYLSLDAINGALTRLHRGYETWAEAQDGLHAAVTQLTRLVAREMARGADDHGRALLAAVNALIDECNAAALSLYQAFTNGVPRQTAPALAALEEAAERLADAAAESKAAITAVESAVLVAQAGIDPKVTQIAKELRSAGDINR